MQESPPALLHALVHPRATRAGAQSLARERTMAQTITYPRRQFEWHDIVRLCGSEAQDWMTEYTRYRPLTRAIAESLEVNRGGDLAAGTALLERAWEELAALEIGDPSIRAVIERWYFGALGYSLYRRGRYDEADAAMAAGEQRVMGVLRRWFLIFLADEAVDFHMHRARIARNQQRWKAMREHMAIARGMRAGKYPYHVADDGSTVSVADVRAFFDALPVPEGATLIAPHLQDPSHGTRDLDDTAREILRIPGMVIYPA